MGILNKLKKLFFDDYEQDFSDKYCSCGMMLPPKCKCGIFFEVTHACDSCGKVNKY